MYAGAAPRFRKWGDKKKCFDPPLFVLVRGTKCLLLKESPAAAGGSLWVLLTDADVILWSQHHDLNVLMYTCIHFYFQL